MPSPHPHLPRALGVAALALWCLLAPATASAYEAAGPRWPGGVIRYHETLPPTYDASVLAAVRAWNTSGARITFVPSTAARAQVVIRFGPVPTGAGAVASLGYQRGAMVNVRSVGRVLSESQRPQMGTLIAHELGHIVGLAHSRARGCQLMDAEGPRCSPRQPWLWRCAMLLPDDLAGAVRLYGRRARPAGTPINCLREPAPPQLTALTARGGIGVDRIKLQWTLPASMPDSARIEVAVSRGPCDGPATSPHAYTVSRTATSWSDGDTTPGTRCYRVRTINRYGWGAPPRSVTVEAGRPPAAPIVHELQEYGSWDSDYLATVELPPSTTLVVRHAPSGACAATFTDGSLVEVSGTGPFSLDQVPEGPVCLSFFALVDSEDEVDIASAATTRELVHAPPG